MSEGDVEISAKQARQLSEAAGNKMVFAHIRNAAGAGKREVRFRSLLSEGQSANLERLGYTVLVSGDGGNLVYW